MSMIVDFPQFSKEYQEYHACDSKKLVGIGECLNKGDIYCKSHDSDNVKVL